MGIMKKNTKIKLAGILLGAALSSTGAYAGNGSCGAGKCGGKEAKKMEKKGSCGAGKCGGDMKKEANEMVGEAKKKVDGSCGAGKCGGDMKKEAKKKNTKIKLAGILLGAALSSTGAYAGNGSCGAGKCGGEAKEEMKEKMEKKGSCGAGKCG